MNNTTYSLIERSRSEEKNRNVLETVLFTLFILSAVASIWQFTQQRVLIPADSAAQCVACVTPVKSTGI